MAKSNIDHIRDIIGKSEFESPLAIELYEFLDAVEEEITDLNDEVKTLKKENSDFESELTEVKEKNEELEDAEMDNEVFLGLDTLRYELVDGNLKIQMQIEHWIEQVQRQNGVIPTPKIRKSA